MERVYKNTNFIFKLLPCLLITMFAFMCLYGSCVFASFDVTSNNETYSLPDFPTTGFEEDYCFIIKEGDVFILFVFPSSVTLSFDYYSSGAIKNIFPHIPSGATGLSYVCKSGFTSWNTSQNPVIYDSRALGFSDPIIFSNFDVYDVDDNLVFQAPPQQVEGIIAKETQGVEMNKTLQEITAILPIVLVVIVGLIALRKAIQFLIRQMKGA